MEPPGHVQDDRSPQAPRTGRLGLGRGRASALAVAGLVAAVSIGGALAVKISLDQAEHDRLAFVATSARDELEAQLARHIEIMEGLQGVFAASQEVERDEFEAYVSSLRLEQRDDEIPWLGFIRWLGSGQGPEWERRIGAELGRGDFAIVPPPAEGEESLVLEFAHAFRDSPPLGQNLAADAAVLEAARAARDAGEIQVTPPLRGFPATPGPAMLLLEPVYTNGVPVDTVVDRRAALQGFVVQAVELTLLFDHADGALSVIQEAVSLAVADAEAGVVGTVHAPRGPLGQDVPRVTKTITFGGRTWVLDFTPQGSLLTSFERALPWVVGGAGLFIALLAGVVVGYQARLASRAEALAARMTEQLRVSEEQFRRSFEDAAVGMALLDAQGRVVEANAETARMLGCPREALVGRHMLDFVFPEDAEAAGARLARLGKEAPSAHFEQRYRRADGSAAWVRISLSALSDGGGRGLQIIAHAQDITEQRAAEQEVRRARDEAQAAARAKADFLATMSHEIRTPLNAVIGLSSLLEGTKLDEEQQDYVRTVRASGDHLLTVINDSLDFSKVESGKLELEESPFDPRRCVEEAVQLLAPRAAEKKLELAFQVDAHVPPGLLGDAARLRQMLVNLLGNAVKFTERGEVVLEVDAERAGDGRVMVTFTVRDTGIGILPERLPHLFQPFTQADASTTRLHGGTGLGLAITRRLAERMGGGVSVESEPGRGSVFRLRIPFPQATPPEPLPAADQAFLGRRALVVDDNATNRRILRATLASWGVGCAEAAGADEALALLARETFDIALLDLAMPGKDGLELAAEVRRLRGRSMPLLLLTSMGLLGRSASDAAVVDALLTKPVRPSVLHDAIATALAGAPRGAEAEPAPGVAAPAHPLRILLAEDNAVNQTVAIKMLRRLGHRADVAGNGIEAVEAVARQPYDVVLMDVQMPELDGLDATRRIVARWARPRRPWIIAMTANAMAGDREACLAAGMDDYVAKPIVLADLAAALARVPQRAPQPPGA